jgi:hypothetical protein
MFELFLAGTSNFPSTKKQATGKGYSVLKQFFLRKKNCARNTPHWLLVYS